MVRRVKVHQVAFGGSRFSKILPANIHALQGIMAGSQVVFLANGRFWVAAHRDVKLAFAVDAPQTVKAGFVEVNKPGGGLDAVLEMVLFSGAVIVFAVMLLGVLAQLCNQRGGIALDDLIRGD